MAIANTIKGMPKRIEYIPNACPILVPKNHNKTNMCPFQKSCDPHFLVSLACGECCDKYSDATISDEEYKRDWF
jgi:hypothetical protein